MEIGSIGNASAMAEMRQRMFAKSDADGSGGLTLEEFTAMGKAAEKNRPEGAGKPAGAPDPSELFAQFDSDGDGQLTQAELDTGMQAMMEARTSRVRLGEDDGTTSLLKVLSESREEAESSTAAKKSADDDEENGVDLQALTAALAQYASVAGGGGGSSSLSDIRI